MVIVLIFMASLHGHWGTAIATYDTKSECFTALDKLSPQYKRKYPKSIMWCSEPIGYSGN